MTTLPSRQPYMDPAQRSTAGQQGPAVHGADVIMHLRQTSKQQGTWENMWVLKVMRPWEQNASSRPSVRLTGSELKSSPNIRALTAEYILRMPDPQPLPCEGMMLVMGA